MSEWNPIETAPKDGTEIWLFCPDDHPQQVQGYYSSEPEENIRYWRPTEMLVSDVVGEIYPTHWMPLPEPPK